MAVGQRVSIRISLSHRLVVGSIPTWLHDLPPFPAPARCPPSCPSRPRATGVSRSRAETRKSLLKRSSQKMRGGGRTSSSMASTCPACDAASPGPGTTPPWGLPGASRASFAALAFSLLKASPESDPQRTPPKKISFADRSFDRLCVCPPSVDHGQRGRRWGRRRGGHSPRRLKRRSASCNLHPTPLTHRARSPRGQTPASSLRAARGLRDREWWRKGLFDFGVVTGGRRRD